MWGSPEPYEECFGYKSSKMCERSGSSSSSSTSVASVVEASGDSLRNEDSVLGERLLLEPRTLTDPVTTPVRGRLMRKASCWSSSVTRPTWAYWIQKLR